MGCFAVAKYDVSFKLHVVRKYLEGKQSYADLANKYSIAGHRQVKKWVDQYLAFGQKAFTKKKNRVYTVQMKLDVLHFMKTTGASLQETANHFQIPDCALISTWKKKLLENGIDALARPKGCPSLTNKPKKVKKKEMTREQALEQENELLRAELAFIKKLRASGENIPSHLLRSKPESSRSFDKHSD